MEKYTIDQLKTEKIAVKIDSKEQWDKLNKLINLTFEYYDKAYYTTNGRWFNKVTSRSEQYKTINFDQIEFDFVLPEKWAVEANDSKIVQQWFLDNGDIIHKSGDYVTNSTYENKYFHFPAFEINFHSRKYHSDPIKQKGYTEITFEQFKQHVLKESNMEQELIGYKLVKPEYEEAAKKISGFIEGGSKPFSDFLNAPNNGFIKALRKAGVLDLWFEPVYKQQFKFKKGDTLLRITKDIILNNFFIVSEVNKVGYILQAFGKKSNTNSDRKEWVEEKFRLATKEEIEAATIKLPVIDGYEGKDNGKMISYGNNCHIASRKNLADMCDDILSFNSPDPKLEGYHGGNFTITHIMLSSGRTVSIEQITQLHNYLKANP